MLLLLWLRPSAETPPYGVNVLKNAAFEQVSGEGLPEHWLPDAYNRVPGVSRYEVVEGDQGNAVHIMNLERNDSRFAQTVSVSPNTVYRLSGRIKADVQDGRGASLSIADVYVVNESLLNTAGEWQELTVYGRTAHDQHELTVWARVGGYSADSQGEAWFDDLSLTALESAPAGVGVDSWSVWRGEPQQAESRHGRAAWPWLLLVCMAYVAAALWLARAVEASEAKATLENSNRAWTSHFWLMLFIAAGSRLLVALLIPGYGVDVACFTSWADRMYAVGPVEFYLTEAHSDYPPGYMLALWPLGAWGQAAGAGATEWMIKLPPILSDLAAITLLYQVAVRQLRPRSALYLSALYAFNPLTYAAGAAWGQVDGLPAVLLVAVVLLALESKWSVALPVYVLAALMKPQALMFGPLGLAALVVDVLTRPDKAKTRSVVMGVLFSLAVAAVVVLPFSPKQQGWDWLIQLYGGTMNYYGYATVNATNLAFLFGLNWQPVAAQAPMLMRILGFGTLAVPTLLYVSPAVKAKKDYPQTLFLAASLLPALMAVILPVSLGTLGALLMVSAFLLILIRYVSERRMDNLPLLGAVLLVLFCVLGAMMHERYLFPAVILLTLAYIRKRDKRVLALLIGVSLLAFLNTGVVLDRGVRIGGVEGHLEAPLFSIISESAWLEYLMSALQVLMAAYALYVGLALSSVDAHTLRLRPLRQADDAASAEAGWQASALDRLLKPVKTKRLKAVDWLIMLAVTALYALLALSNLGATTAPESAWVSESSDETIVFDLGESRAFKVLYFGGLNWRDSDFEVAASDDGENWLPHEAKLEDGDLYSWQYQTQLNTPGSNYKYSSAHVVHHGRYVRVRSQMIGTNIIEMQFRDAETAAQITPTLVEGLGQALVDEQGILTGEPSWYESMYFDEIYHARTAFEHLNAIRGVEPNATYEVSHPPLGKVLMSFSIMVFGMTPFGWRFAGALAGVLMLPGLYLLGHLLTRKRLFSLAAMLLFALDTMHFTQTRIATIDSFVTLFIIYSYYFMFRYMLSNDWRRPFLRTLPNLALSGLFMGLAVASKWTGIYAGMGLAVLFFWTQWRRIGEGLAAESALSAQAEQPSEHSRAIQTAAKEWKRRLVWTLLSCVVFFVAVPAAIYILSFLPWFMRTPGGLTVRKVIDASISMFNYHADPGRGMDHPFFSPWYQWPLIYKPMWFYSGKVVDGTGSSIITFGNPAVWWGGLLGLLATAGSAVVRRTGGIARVHSEDRRDIWPAMLLISFLAQYLPWVLVPRGTYIYHYFPSVPFIILCAVYALNALHAKHKRLGTGVTLAYIGLAAALFVAFFPYASGIRTDVTWLEAMRWFPNWLYY